MPKIIDYCMVNDAEEMQISQTWKVRELSNQNPGPDKNLRS